ncbi:sigma-70 family RNA polymerase sigma factor [Bythopirellula polymerisocia]|uniref:RNA polymerase sigma factor n=1 Tax=Bythopirellula polymerisocia TaxID=2528003 RepID=A0A5C6D022_9BACT|nr:sigma-70 family RNA polymerase sigma factor [Bythopirellula polymerisocia]TWU30463.1 RNA polymerase sigma factor [Bythopirellula polymerisocia]
MSNSDANTERFVELLGAHERELIAYVYALTMNWNDAQEIMQRVRIRLWQQFDSYDEAKPFGAWARAVSYYLVLAFRKEKSRQREYFAEAVLELVSETYERGVDQAVQRREALMKCLDKLSAEQRGVVDRCYANNEKIVDVAQQMGITSGALRQSLFRIRKSLQDCVQRFARSS